MTHDYTPNDNSHIRNSNTERYLPFSAANSISAVSWGAIFAGAVGAASLAMILLMLGVGLGLSSVSPYVNHGMSAGTIGIATIAWLIFTQIAASGMGGYLAGRLRTKWVDTHTNEVYFRDTAHGFLAWAVASLISAVLLTSTIGSIMGNSAKAVGSVAGGASSLSINSMLNEPSGGQKNDFLSMSYFVNSLFRSDANSSSGSNSTSSGMPSSDSMTQSVDGQRVRVTSAQLAEVTGIFANSISTGSLPDNDLHYVAQLVSQNTGISQKEAEQRVQSIYAKAQSKVQEAKTFAKQAADKALKTSSYLTLWTFVSLLSGAFIASLCATYGGRQRDL